MKYANSKTGWAIAILVLVLINIATLATFWYNNHRMITHQPPPNGGGGAAKFLVKELAFDSAQQKAYRQLIMQHLQDVQEIKVQVKAAKEAYFSLLADSTATAESIKAAINRAATIEEQIDIKTFEHFKQVRALCNANQQKKFDTIIKEVVRMMGPDKQQGPPPPRREAKDDKEGRHRPPPPDGEGFPPPPPDDNPPPR